MRVSPFLLAFLLTTTAAYSQTDAGPRTGPAGAGGPLPTVDPIYFAITKKVFEEVDDVAGGLGPRFNMNSCGGCHAQPATGGTSPSVNPQIAIATLNGATNKVPSFITANGPVREARFKSDGGVHDLFVITGRADAGGCHIQQPDFATELKNNNVSFRIPTPTFGLGLVEATPDGNLEHNFQNQLKYPGINGHFNRTGNDGTITRFGWKAQNKSLLIFSGEAYNVEQGVTNEAFPNERDDTPGCRLNPTPEDKSTPTDASDVTLFAAFMNMLAPPKPSPAMASPTFASVGPIPATGNLIFKAIGCIGCHIEKQTTGASNLTNGKPYDYFPFSDFAVHNMGTGLADDISQGNATGDEFRTAPLWGLGQRLFFLHDGRTSNLVEAIEAHASSGSEANIVINNYNHLPVGQKQQLINYLRSL